MRSTTRPSARPEASRTGDRPGTLEADMSDGVILRIVDLSKHFGALKAVDSINLDIYVG